jgi:hypothetical protein
MTNYISEKTLKSVFPNVTGYYDDLSATERLTERQFKLLQEAVTTHKVSKDSVREVERFEYDHKNLHIKEIHVRGGAGKGYQITIPYNRRYPKSRLHWVSDRDSG